MQISDIRQSFKPHRVLDLLIALRALGVLAYSAALAFLAAIGNPPPVWAWSVPIALLVANIWLWRSRGNPATRAASTRVGLHLGGDTLALFALLWATGGAANPFVSLFLVPVAVAAVALRPAAAIALTGWCALGYTVLLGRYLDLHAAHLQMSGFAGHVVGMWLNFIVAAVLLCGFLLAVSAALRAGERELAAERERLLRDDAIVSVATLAAGAAHALNTPLGTMALASESLAERDDLDAEAREEVATIAGQVQVCAAQLRQLVDAGGGGQAERCALPDYARRVIERWHARRPEIESVVHGIDALPGDRLRDDAALTQALINLLDNAADASLGVDDPRVVVRWCRDADDDAVVLIIDDSGAETDHARLRTEPTVSTKTDGLGLGLTLARASIRRLGGRLTLAAGPGGGTRTRVTLPLAALREAPRRATP